MCPENPFVLYLPGSEPEGMIGRIGERFALARTASDGESIQELPSEINSKPFGLKYLIPIASMTDPIDHSRITYCHQTQMSLIDGQPWIAMATKADVATPTEKIEDRQRMPDTVIDGAVPD